MSRAERERREAQDEAQRRGRRSDPAEAPPTDAVLALQRTAGNRAVTGMLARDKAPQDTATSTTSQLGDLGVVPLDAASWDANGKEVHIVFGQSEIVTKFMHAYTEGRALDPAWISSPVAKSTLTGALISQAQLSERTGLVSASLNFEKVEHDFVKH